MRIDSATPQPPQPPQRINDMAARTKEVAGEREHDGDADDKVQKQIKPQEVGNKVDLFA